MTEMPNKEALDFNRPEEIKDFPVRTDGTSALKLDVADEILKEKGRDAQIGEIRESIDRSENVLPFTRTIPEGALITNYPGAEVQKAPRGVVGPVGNQGRETSGGDKTGGEKKVKLPKWAKRLIAGVAAVVALGTGVKIADNNGVFDGNGGNKNSGTVMAASGEMESLQPTDTSNVETTPTAEVSATPEVTQSPSSEVTEAPTPTLDEFGFSEERKAELNQQIQDFLNKQGEFTPEKVSSMMIETASEFDKNKVGLGVADAQPKLEGYFFDYIEKDGSLIMLMGFDGNNGERFVVPCQVALYFLKGYTKSHFYFMKYSDNTVFSQAYDTANVTGGNIDSFFSNMDSLIGKFIMVSPAVFGFSESADDYDGIAATYIKEHDSKINLSGKLISLVDDNGIKIDGGFDKTKFNDYSISTIESINDINNIELSKIPLMDMVIICY